VKDVQGRIVRRCRVTLAHEFTPAIARALGKDAKPLLEALREGSIEKATMPIDGLAAAGAFTAHGGGVSIGKMVGVKAVASKSSEEDSGPTIQLEFDFPWDKDAWVFLGEHCSAMADVVLTKRQLALDLQDEQDPLSDAAAAFHRSAERMGAKVSIETPDGKTTVLADHRKNKN
jgi:hypothetical protein